MSDDLKAIEEALEREISGPPPLPKPAASPPAPAGTQPTSLVLRGVVGASIALAILACVVPAFLSWFSFTMFGYAGTAELLEHTDGLVPSTFRGGYWRGWIINGWFIAWALLRLLRRTLGASTGSPWLPMILLSAFYGVLGVGLVSIDLAGLDVPDVWTTALLMGAFHYLWFFLVPLCLLSVAKRLSGALWRAAALSKPQALRVLTLTAGVALSGSITTAVFVGSAVGGLSR